MTGRLLLLVGTFWLPGFSDRVASYSFSGNAMDGSGNEYHGTVVGASLTADRFGTANSAFAFDGLDDVIHIPNMGLSGTVSISGWFFFNGNIWPNHMAFIGQATSYHERWTFGGSNEEIFWYDRRGSDNAPYRIETRTSAGSWHHLVAVVGRNPVSALQVEVYRDGQFLGNVSTRGIQDIGTPYQIGSFWTEWGWEFSRGSLDDIQIYNHALDLDEIRKLYSAPPVPEPSSIALMLFGLLALSGLNGRGFWRK